MHHECCHEVPMNIRNLGITRLRVLMIRSDTCELAHLGFGKQTDCFLRERDDKGGAPCVRWKSLGNGAHVPQPCSVSGKSISQHLPLWNRFHSMCLYIWLSCQSDLQWTNIMEISDELHCEPCVLKRTSLPISHERANITYASTGPISSHFGIPIT